LHRISPGWQLVAQVPWLQMLPLWQTVPAFTPLQFPEAPQKMLLVSGSVHRPLQSTRPAWQESLQTPALHANPGAHTVPALIPVQLPLAPQ
jgi:hypothetical protein